MRSFDIILKALRETRGWTQSELAKRAGLKKSHIAVMETRKKQNPSHKTICNLSRAFGYSDKEFLKILTGEEDIHPRESFEQILDRLRLVQPVAIPIYEQPVHAGEPSEPIDYIYRTRTKIAPQNIEGYIVSGHCLEPSINSGDIIIVDRDAEIETGEIVACLMEGKIWLGRVKRVNDKLCINNNNICKAISEVNIIAPVIEVIRRLK